ncbi:hypothetical protein NQZ68_013509 [Dissostichus eleginoides]|nr:hypothetical protein NQZ68_013509 [Dissostichus eleginoides]
MAATEDGEPVDLKTESEYAGRVEDLCENNICTLRIKNLRESDSAEYRFRFTTNQDVYASEPVTLSVTGVNAQACNTVAYSERSTCAPKGSSVDISCTYRSYEKNVKSKFWFRPERSHQDLSKDSQYSGRVVVISPLRGSTLRISDLRDSDSAQYRFKFKTPSFEWRSDLPGTTLTVTALQVQVITATVQQSDTLAKLKCHSSCSPAGVSYVWFKNGEKISTTTISSYKGWFQHRDRISCALEGHEGFPSPAVYSPKLPSVSVSPSAEIKEGSSVTLTCSSDANPAANYTWNKKNRNPNVPLLSEGTQLFFRSIQSSDSGEYYCSAENELGRRTSANTFIDVKYAPKLPSVSVSPSAEIEEGSSVTLTCSSDANPAATYTWNKKNGKSDLPPLSDKPQLVFRSIQSSDSGQYFCTAENKLGTKASKEISIDVHYAPKTSSVSASPSAEIEIGKSLQLTCKGGANPEANYTWYKDNQTLPGGSKDIYQLASITLEDKGNYHCESKNKYGQINSTSVHIDVQYAPKLPFVSVSPSAEIEEGSSVTLTCSSDANPAAKYTWYKKNEDSPKASGQIFNITDFRAEHSGSYYCGAQNKIGRLNSTLHLSVVADHFNMQ